MSGIIHFSSGKTLEITEAEFQIISPKLNNKGIKTQKTRSGHLIPLNSMTMEFIEHVDEPEESQATEVNEMPTLPKPKVIAESPKAEPEAKDKPKTQDEKLAEMLEKSNCKHEPEKMELFVQHTAKGIRYFPVCSFCGRREKYISERKVIDNGYVGTPNEKWTEADLANALPWVEN